MTTASSAKQNRSLRHVPPPVTASVVPPRRGSTRGWMAHRAAVDRLVDSYRAIPPGAGVGWPSAPPTCSAARATAGPGLDVSGLTGVISVDPQARAPPTSRACAPTRTWSPPPFRTGDAAVVPQLKTITLGGAVTGLGIESTSFRNGLPHESVLEMDVLTGGGEVVTATPEASTPTSSGLPQLLRHAGLRPPAPDQLEPVAALRARCGTCASTRPRRARGRDRPDRRRRASDDGDRSTSSTAGVLPDRGLPQPRPLDRRAPAGQRLHRPADLLPLDPARASGLPHGRTTTSGAGTPTGSGARGLRRAAPAGRRLWPRRLRAQRRLLDVVGLENRYRHGRPGGRLRGRPARERVVQDVEIPVERTADSCAGSSMRCR